MAVMIVFDFDKTILDCDSDNWVADGLGFTKSFEELTSTMPWNLAMDIVLGKMHSQGITIEDIADCLRKAPLIPHIASTIKTAHSLGCELRIVSDANTFFIETILKHHGLLDCFSEINTNPSIIDNQGRLRIFPCHDLTSPNCISNLDSCPPNMCKGRIIERIKANAEEGKKKIIYLGDGKGDYCPMLRLKKEYFVMPRKDYPVWELISCNPSKIKAKICEWSVGEELERTLLNLVRLINFFEDHKADFNNADVVISTALDCKFQLVALSPHEAFVLPPVPL
ncbi:hypothetical protein Syun_017603 [Stephania yunnanensis]|uniref:Uncharacterized protein n=1 Tax=Stephania yunnanensis TaxID=152371 RepID=A0AAP0J7B9_9MAGN